MISPALRPHLTPQLVSLADNDGKGRGEEEEEGGAVSMVAPAQDKQERERRAGDQPSTETTPHSTACLSCRR